MNKNIIKIIIVIVIIASGVVGIKLLLNNFTSFKESDNKSTIVTLIIIWLFYQCIVTWYVNQKNKKYMNLPIKQTMGKKIGKVRTITPGWVTTGNNDGSEIWDDGNRSANYSFEINGKIYKKRIFFKYEDNVPEEINLYYRVGKKDITNEEKPQLNNHIDFFCFFFVLIMTAFTYALIHNYIIK